MAEAEGLIVKFGANTVEFDNSVTGINKALTGLRKEFSNINRELKFDPDNTELLTKKLDNLKEQARVGAIKLEELRKKQKELGEEKVGTSEWNKLNIEIEKVEGTMKVVGRAAQETEKNLKEASNPLSITNLDKALDEVAKDLETVNKKLQLNPKDVEASAEKMRLLEKQTELANQKVETLKKEQKALGEEKIGSSEWKNYEAKIVDAQLAVKNLGDEAKNTGEKSDALNDIGKKLDFQNFLMASEQISKMGDQIKAFAQNAVAEFEKFDSILDNFTAMTGIAGDEAQKLRDSILEDIDTGNFEGLTKAIGAVAQTTGKMGDEIKDTSKTLFQFSELTGTDAVSNMQSATKTMRAFGMADEDLDKVLNSTLSTYQKTGVSTTELLSSLQKSAPALKTLGLNFTQSTNLVAAFNKAGLESGTSLNYMEKAMAKFSKDGLSFDEGIKNISNSIKNAKNDQEAYAIAVESFGTKGASSMLQALKSGALSFDNLGDSANDAANTVSETFEKTVDPIDASKEAVQRSKEELGKLGGTIMTSLTPVIKTLTSVVSGLLSWFNNLDGTVQTIIVTVGAVIVAVAALMPLISGVISSIKIIIPLIQSLFAVISAHPLAALIVAITAVVAAIIWFFTQTEIGKKIIEDFWNFIKYAWENIKNKTVEIWEEIKKFFKNTIDGIVGFCKELPDKIFNFFKQIPGKIVEAIGNLSSIGSKIVEDIINGFGNLGQKIKDAIMSALNWVKNSVGNIWGSIFGGSEKSFGGSFKDFGGSIQNLFKAKDFSLPEFKLGSSSNEVTNFNIKVEANNASGLEIARTIERQIVRRLSK